MAGGLSAGKNIRVSTGQAFAALLRRVPRLPVAVINCS
jgi:hypothetical protein